MMKNNFKNQILEFFKFIIVGTTAALINLLTYYSCINLNIHPSFAYSIGYFISLIFNYILTLKFTFKTKHSNTKGAQFLFTHIFNYLLQLFILNILIMTEYIDIAPILTQILYIPISFLLIRRVLK